MPNITTNHVINYTNNINNNKVDLGSLKSVCAVKEKWTV